MCIYIVLMSAGQLIWLLKPFRGRFLLPFGLLIHCQVCFCLLGVWESYAAKLTLFLKSVCFTISLGKWW